MTMKRRTLVTGWIIGALAMASSLWQPAAAAETDSAATELEAYCHNWAHNGMMGVSVCLRGGHRKITYIDENELRYLLKHQAAHDNLYLLRGERPPAEKRYLEESLLAGYDRADRWMREHGGEKPDTANWETEAYEACMKDAPEALRALLAGQ